MAKTKQIPTVLTPEQQEAINAGALILVGTIDHESGAPAISAISWVKAVDSERVRFSVTSNSRIYANVKANPQVSLCFIGLGTVYTVSGNVHVLAERMEGVAMPLTRLELSVGAVFESMFWGAAITQEPAYEKTYDKEKAEALEVQVYEALIR